MYLWYYNEAIKQMYLKEVTAPFGWTSGWAAPDGLEYLTLAHPAFFNKKRPIWCFH